MVIPVNRDLANGQCTESIVHKDYKIIVDRLNEGDDSKFLRSDRSDKIRHYNKWGDIVCDLPERKCNEIFSDSTFQKFIG